MFLKPAKVILFASLPFWGNAKLFAQNISRPFENNPYSRYGIGADASGLNPALKAMGSATAAFVDPYIINTDNPASYASIKNVSYEGGAEGRKNTISSGNNTYQTGTTNVAYLNFAIPLGKHAGMLLGFKPQSIVSYQLYDTIQSQIGSSALSYNGTGGTNYFFMGGAGKYKGLSIGANLGYLFGTIAQSSWLKTLSTTASLSNSEFLRVNSIGGLYAKLGLLYEAKLAKDYSLTFGANANLKQNVSSQINEYWISHPFYASDTAGADTAYKTDGSKGKLTLPTTYNLGLVLSNGDKWNLSLSYQGSNWAQFKNQNLKDSVGNSTYRMSIGGSYTPNSLSIYNYWQRVTYRLGCYMGKDYVQINQYQMSYYGASLGLSLPFKRSNDRIHTAMEFGRMGNKGQGNGFQQNFVRFSLGLSFSNNTWFIKRKYD